MPFVAPDALVKRDSLTTDEELDPGADSYARRSRLRGDDVDAWLAGEMLPDESNTAGTIHDGSALEPFDAQSYLAGRFGDRDAVDAILEKVTEEWMFSTTQVNQSFVSDGQAEPVAFNEVPQQRWDCWQDAIAELRERHARTNVVATMNEEWFDVPLEVFRPRPKRDE